MNATQIVVQPTWEPVSVAEARAHCRIDLHDDDVLLGTLITAARQHIELIAWQAIPQQTIDLWLEEFEDDEIELPNPPLQSVTYVKYYDTADVEYTLAASEYFLNTVVFPGEIHLKYGKYWPTIQLRDYNAVNVRYVAGFATPEAVPQRLKQAILLLVGHWYENREDSVSGTISRSIEFAVKALIGADRMFRF